MVAVESRTMLGTFSKHAPRIALIAALGAFVAGGTNAASTRFGVTATVRAVAWVEQESQPADLRITALDLRRGFVDVATPVALVVRSNSPSGFAVDVTALEPLATSIVIGGLDSEVSLGPEGGTFVERWRRPQEVGLSLNIRFVLAPGLVAGDYPWPLRLTVRPLESI